MHCMYLNTKSEINDLSCKIKISALETMNYEMYYSFLNGLEAHLWYELYGKTKFFLWLMLQTAVILHFMLQSCAVLGFIYV